MDRTEKEQAVAEFKKRFVGAAGVFIADYQGLTVEEVNELRKSFRKAGVEYSVVKNTLLRLAIAGTELDVLREHLKGTTALAIARTDAVTAAKAALDFAKTHDKFKMRAAFVEGQTLLAAGVKTLSTMPSQGEIRAQLLGLLNAPAAKLLAQLNAPGQQIAGVLQAHVDELQKAAA